MFINGHKHFFTLLIKQEKCKIASIVFQVPINKLNCVLLKFQLFSSV